MQFIHSFYHFVWIVKIKCSPYIKSSLYMHKTACICIIYVHSYMKVYLHWDPSVRGSSSWLPAPAVQQTGAVALCTIFDLAAESSIW